MQSLVTAVRMASRGLVRGSSTSLLAVCVLALGLSAPVTFFSLLVGATRPLPVPGGNRVIRVDVVQPSSGGTPMVVYGRDLDLLEGAGSLESLGGFRVREGSIMDPEIGGVRVSAAVLTPEVLPLLQVGPVLGRAPVPPEVDVAVLIGYRLWEDVYEGDPEILGRRISFLGEGRTITGVLPEGFGFPFNQNAWVVARVGPGDGESVQLVGRLAPGASLEAASAELDTRWKMGDQARAPERRGGNLQVRPFTGGRGESGEGVAFLGLVLVAVALLLIACANVANLLLVRATDRVKGLGVQSALGAGRIQLSAQLFLEALLLALAGGGLGILLAWTGVDVIQRTLSVEHFGYFWMRMAIDGRVLLFASILVCGTAAFAGTLPIVWVLGADLQGVLKAGGEDLLGGRGGSWTRVFVGTQLAFSCAALVAAGLTGGTLARSGDFGEGVPAKEVLVASLDMGEMTDADVESSEGLGSIAWEQRVAALDQVLTALPGASSSALAMGAPGYSEPWGDFQIEGASPQGGQGPQRAFWNAVTPDFFSVLDLGIERGRGFAPEDTRGAPPVALVDEAFVARYLSDGNPLGRSLRIPGADSTALFTIVGVASSVEVGTGDQRSLGRIYLSLPQVEGGTMTVLLRAVGEPIGLARPLREAVARADPQATILSVRTLADAYAYLTRVPRTMAAIALVGGVIGLLVATVGLYGLLSVRVRRRRRELGVRSAVGASSTQLATEVVKLALRQILPALAVGLLLAWLAAPILGVLLLGSDPRSPLTYLGVAIAFLAAGLASALIPARRAAAVEPAQVLRGE